MCFQCLTDFLKCYLVNLLCINLIKGVRLGVLGLLYFVSLLAAFSQQHCLASRLLPCLLILFYCAVQGKKPVLLNGWHWTNTVVLSFLVFGCFTVFFNWIGEWIGHFCFMRRTSGGLSCLEEHLYVVFKDAVHSELDPTRSLLYELVLS